MKKLKREKWRQRRIEVISWGWCCKVWMPFWAHTRPSWKLSCHNIASQTACSFACANIWLGNFMERALLVLSWVKHSWKCWPILGYVSLSRFGSLTSIETTVLARFSNVPQQRNSMAVVVVVVVVVVPNPLRARSSLQPGVGRFFCKLLGIIFGISLKEPIFLALSVIIPESKRKDTARCGQSMSSLATASGGSWEPQFLQS